MSENGIKSNVLMEEIKEAICYLDLHSLSVDLSINQSKDSAGELKEIIRNLYAIAKCKLQNKTVKFLNLI